MNSDGLEYFSSSAHENGHFWETFSWRMKVKWWWEGGSCSLKHIKFDIRYNFGWLDLHPQIVFNVQIELFTRLPIVTFVLVWTNACMPEPSIWEIKFNEKPYDPFFQPIYCFHILQHGFSPYLADLHCELCSLMSYHIKALKCTQKCDKERWLESRNKYCRDHQINSVQIARKL